MTEHGLHAHGPHAQVSVRLDRRVHRLSPSPGRWAATRSRRPLPTRASFAVPRRPRPHLLDDGSLRGLANRPQRPSDGARPATSAYRSWSTVRTPVPLGGVRGGRVGVRVRGRRPRLSGPGGTVGLSGTFEDPAGMRQASLLAGLYPARGRRRRARARAAVGPAAPAVAAPSSPRSTGSVYAAAHALTGYVTKPLHAPASSRSTSPAGGTSTKQALIRGTCSSTSPGSSGSGCSSRWARCTTSAAQAARRAEPGGWSG